MEAETPQLKTVVEGSSLRARLKRVHVSEGWKWAGLAGFCAACSATLFFANPSAPGTFYPPCPFHLATGLWCPGCGTTRALYQLLHGNVGAALALNPLMVVTLPFIVYVAAMYALRYIRGRALPRFFVSPAFNIAVSLIIVAYWVLRNIPVFPLTLLAPHA